MSRADQRYKVDIVVFPISISRKYAIIAGKER